MTKTDILFLENRKTGEPSDIQAGLYDICEWILETYPKDIFVRKPVVIIELRGIAEKILKMRKRL